MPALILTILAPIGAWVHLRKERPASRERMLEVYLLWWLALAIGAATAVGGLFHLFDGAAVAESIGYTRGDGGFQFENGMGDIAIGVAGLLCIKFRGSFWLAVLVVTAIQYYGDAYGHICHWIENDNTQPNNIGIPLWMDLIVPTVGLALYALRSKASAQARMPKPATPAPVSPVEERPGEA